MYFARAFAVFRHIEKTHCHFVCFVFGNKRQPLRTVSKTGFLALPQLHVLIHVNKTEVKSKADLKRCMSFNIKIGSNKQNITKVKKN